jgi:tRNA pseudouridine13 synthase
MPEVKELTEEDLPNYTIFDVVMPLPGWNIDYPGGKIGQLYRDAMLADGVNPDKMRREQK